MKISKLCPSTNFISFAKCLQFCTWLFRTWVLPDIFAGATTFEGKHEIFWYYLMISLSPQNTMNISPSCTKDIMKNMIHWPFGVGHQHNMPRFVIKLLRLQIHLEQFNATNNIWIDTNIRKLVRELSNSFQFIKIGLNFKPFYTELGCKHMSRAINKTSLPLFHYSGIFTTM